MVINSGVEVGTAARLESEFTTATCAVHVTIVTPNDDLQGFAQGSGLPLESRKRSISAHNFTQIFKTPYSVANTLKACSLYGGSELQRLRLRKAIQHQIDIETAVLFQGGGTEGTDWGELPGSAENPLTRMKGLGVGQTDGFIVSKNADSDSDFVLSISDCIAASNATVFNNWMGMIMDDLIDSPTSTKVLFCGSGFRSGFSEIASEFNSGGFVFGDHTNKGKLGVVVKTLESAEGNLRIVPHPRFRGRWSNYGLIMDMRNVRMRPLQTRDTKLETHVGERSVDGQVDNYITETGLECMHESTHAIVKIEA